MKSRILGILAVALSGVGGSASAEDAVNIANTGALGFDSTGNLTLAFFGTNCNPGGCSVSDNFLTPIPDEWAVEFPFKPSFLYSVPLNVTYPGSVSLSLVSQSNSRTTYDFTVTAIDGPLNGDVSTGSFTFNDSIIPTGGGIVSGPYSGLLTDLSFTWDGISYVAHGVPEPATLSLLALGLAGAGLMSRRKKN